MRGLLLATLLLQACGAPPPGRWAHDPADRTPYDEALKTWTRAQETYEHFESRVFVRATYFSPSFAAAHARFRTERLGLDPATAKRSLNQAVSAAGDKAKFFVSVVTNDPYWNDMHRRDGTLRATLRMGDEAFPPIAVKRLTNDEMADLAPFFPYLDLLATGYWATFPLPPKRKRVHLRVAGPPAVIDLVWDTQ